MHFTTSGCLSSRGIILQDKGNIKNLNKSPDTLYTDVPLLILLGISLEDSKRLADLENIRGLSNNNLLKNNVIRS